MSGAYSKLIPSELLEGEPDSLAFVKVLDAVESYKQLLLNKNINKFTKPMFMSKTELVKVLYAVGFQYIPDTLTIGQLIQLYINSNRIMRWKGSKKGILLWLWCVTQGTINESTTTIVLPTERFISFENPISRSYLAGDRPSSTSYGSDSHDFYLCSSADDYGYSTVTINVTTPYYLQYGLSSYISNHLKEFAGFLGINPSITVNLTSGSYAASSYANSYFSTF